MKKNEQGETEELEVIHEAEQSVESAEKMLVSEFAFGPNFML